MYRFADLRLDSWIEQSRPKPMVLRGARQVGKSTLVYNLAKRKGFKLYEINLENHPELNTVFLSNDLKKILLALEGVLGEPINPHKALLFLDEIQGAPAALQALRSFYEQKDNAISVIAAGSLLEFALESYPHSMPVGRIEFLHLGPMTFEEFLIATGNQYYQEFLKQFTIDQTIEVTTHNRLCELKRLYFAVGGMPEAVLKYRQTESLQEVQKVQQFIIDTYREDFWKYAKKLSQKTIQLIRMVYDYVPTAVGQKFTYARVSKDVRAAEVKKALDMLALARIVHIVMHSACSGVPLKIHAKENVFKTLFLDVGLMNRMCGIDWTAISGLDNDDLVNKGSIAEQAIGQTLAFDKEGVESPLLHYWLRENKSSSAEIDYVISTGDLVVPVEVKSGSKGTMKSLIRFAYEKESKLAIRFDLNPPALFDAGLAVPGLPHKRAAYQILSLPLYLVGQVKRLLNEYRQK